MFFNKYFYSLSFSLPKILKSSPDEVIMKVVPQRSHFPKSTVNIRKKPGLHLVLLTSRVKE